MTKEELMSYAIKALDHSYAPYSQFPVGAAILLTNGEVITGVNVENVSFGVTNCAERTAIFTAITNGYKKGDIQAIAVAGKTEDFLPPCNVCRQVLVEFCSPEMPVYLLNGAGDILSLTLADLVPYSFTSLSM
ncbi:cytidine deaminase [Carnobacteriaceae bacterium zg-ZUI252]|nr:cytidine deaminase [Carnobacteriaceae bacterium zg-ZUI252]MBS4770275.1 cytidine deaminase [Carnobacteriaceae bacterium zg-ZUI240]QTU82436.1 cytidine deaminase [Carnobacteriaceae bacterium zg-C25]